MVGGEVARGLRTCVVPCGGSRLSKAVAATLRLAAALSTNWALPTKAVKGTDLIYCLMVRNTGHPSRRR
eukprot:4439134-Prymnesium_polylepis.2